MIHWNVQECNLGDKGVHMNGRTPLLAAVAIWSRVLTIIANIYRTFDPVKS